MRYRLILKESGNRMLTLNRYVVLKDMIDITGIVKNIDSIYLDTDIHLTEDTIIDYIKLQKSIVKPTDTFILLGDIILDEDTEKLRSVWYNFFSKLNGKYKFLVLGNNDLLKRKFYIEKCGFNTASLSLKLESIIFTHVPTHTGSPDLINIHGHVHRNGERRIWVNTTGKRCIKDNKPFSYINETNIPITKPIKLIKVLELIKHEV